MPENGNEEETFQNQPDNQVSNSTETWASDDGIEFDVLPPEERITLDDPPTGDEESFYDDPDEGGQFVVLCIACAVVIVLFVGLAFIIYAWIMSFVPSWVLIILVAVSVVLPVFWAHGTIKEAKRRRPTPLRLAIPVNPDFMWVSQENLRKLLNALTVDANHASGSDTAIELVTRKSQWSWVRSSRLQIVGLMVAGYFAFHGIPPYLWLLITAVLLLWIGLHYANWVSWYLIITDKRVYVVIQPPVWLWWRDNEPFPQLLNKIQNCHPDKQSTFGNYFNYGLVVAEIQGNTDDEVFNRIDFMPRRDEVSQLINLLQAD